jgi:outer membrane immunogenic protein
MKMKKFAISVAALAISTGSALAADLPSRKAAPILPPPPPPAPIWTGFYVGLNAGGTWADSSATVTSLPLLPGAEVLAGLASGGLSGNSSGGFIGGGQIGYNYQFYNNFVIGVEADIQGLAKSSGNGQLNTFVNPVWTNVSVNGSLDYFGTVRGRLGWLFTPTLLIYGTGGFAYGGVTLNSSVYQSFGNVAGLGSSSFSDTLTGWTAGGGVEWMFLPNWSAKVEYLRYDLGTVNQTAIVSQVGVPYMGTTTRARIEGNVVRAGLNYHFNWGAAPAPVLAKY